METKANYLLIGLFTILGFLGLLAFFLWFARIELDRQFAYYDIRFDSVSGLSTASDVRFSGLPVGQVVDVRLAPERDGTIAVRVEIAAETPVRADSVATIEAQGVTGVSFVGIGPGSAEAPLLDAPPGEVPEIAAGRSTLQSLTEDAPELVSELLNVVEEIGDLFEGENAGRLERILVNVEDASDEFASTLEGFAGVTGATSQFTEQIERFNTTLDDVTTELSTVLSTANEMLASIDLLADQTTAVVASGTNTLNAAEVTLIEAERFIAEDLVATTDDVQTTLASLRDEVATLRADATALMATLAVSGTTATARLEEVAGTIARMDRLFDTLDTTGLAVTDAATRIDDLLEREGEPLLIELRAAVADATEMIAAITVAATEDLPAVMADIRVAAQSARTTVATVGADLTEATQGVPEMVARAAETLTQATATFAAANETLAAVNGALDAGQRTLAVAETAFAEAGALIGGGATALVEDLRGAVGRLESTIDAVAGDVPVITADLRAASQAAADAFAEVQGMVDAATPGVQAFTANALPLYTRLAQETRDLIANLDGLTQRVTRNPTQFFLDRAVPEFTR